MVLEPKALLYCESKNSPSYRRFIALYLDYGLGMKSAFWFVGVVYELDDRGFHMTHRGSEGIPGC